METIGGKTDLRGREIPRKGERRRRRRRRRKEGKERREKGEGKKERKKEIIFDRMFRRDGSEFRIGGGARGARILSMEGVGAINETDCRNDRTLGRDSVDKYMPGVLWKLLAAQRRVI